MSAWRTITQGLRSLVRRDELERDLDDELRHYLEMATRENVRRGMTPEEAERAARVQLGGGHFEAAKETVRSGGWEASVSAILQELRLAARGLRRSPAFTIVAVLSLALGIGATTTMFSVMNAVMFRPLPYRDAEELALIWTNDPRRGLPREATAYLTITDWQSRSRAFRDIAFYMTSRESLTHHDPERGRGRTRVANVSSNFFALVGTAPAMGRVLSPLDVTDRANVAVISHRFWQRWFDGAPDVIGKTIALGDASAKDGMGAVTVIGVMPADFYFPDRATEIFTPATLYWRFDRETSERFQDWARRWTGIGRLAPGVSIEAARADLAAIGRQLAAANPTNIPDFPGFGTTVLPVLDAVAGTGLRSSLWMLLATVGLVLLVVCANVANLILARGATRHREFAVRRALGAGRGRIVRELFAESALLALVGGVIGVFIATWGTPLLASAAASYLPRMDEVALDVRVLGFGLTATIVSALAFGLLPALRLSSTDANEALREGGRGTGSIRLRRSQGAMVLAESALALVLLTGAGLLLKSLSRLNAVDPGFDPSNVLTVRVEYPPEARPTAPPTPGVDPGAPRARAREQSMDEMLTRLRTIPGVEAVGYIDDMFQAGQGNASITIPGRLASAIPPGELAEANVTPGFFPVMRVPLRRGRYLTRDDALQKTRALFNLVLGPISLADKERLATPEPVVVNEAFVHRFFRDEDPIGRKFCVDPTGKTYWFEIVGVVGDMRRSGRERAVMPQFYGPFIPNGNGRADLVVRAQRDPLALVATIRAEVTRAVPGIVVVSVSTLEAGLDSFSAQRRFQTWLITLFALIAVGLAAVGIFGLAHYAVAERRREIGVRVALGASPRDVLRLLIAQGMRMPVLGIAIGVAISMALARVIASQLYSVEPTDPVTFAAVATALTLVAASACYLAARRAAKADPVQALRED
jgi:predicted permease